MINSVSCGAFCVGDHVRFSDSFITDVNFYASYATIKEVWNSSKLPLAIVHGFNKDGTLFTTSVLFTDIVKND